jgi:hypothetical protein
MNGRTIARVLLAVVLVAGVVTLGVGAYNAGVTAGLAQTGQVVVTNGGYLAPGAAYVGYGWGLGWGHGFGFFGFLGGLLFLFLVIGLIRAAFGGPRRGWGSGYGPGPRHGWGSGWEERARDAHDAWHRAHPDGTSTTDLSSPTGA